VATEPEQLERDIAKTRERLGRDVDVLAEKVSPTAAAKRRVEKVREGATSIRERVMGTVTDKTSTAGETMHNAKESVTDAAHTARESVTDAAQTAKTTVRRQTSGNPLAAGAVAFGVGWLLSSLIPTTRAEEQLGGTIKEKATDQAGAIKQGLKSAASSVADDLREPAKEALEQVKQTATESMQSVKDETTSEASTLAGEAKDRSRRVAETAQEGNSTNSAYSAGMTTP